MGLERVTVTISDNLLKEIDEIAKERHEDRSAALRQVLSIGINEVKIKDALDSYIRGKVSIEKAAELAGVSIWKIIELLKEKKVPLRYSAEDAEKEIKAIMEKYRYL